MVKPLDLSMVRNIFNLTRGSYRIESGLFLTLTQTSLHLRGLDAFDPSRVLHVLRVRPGGAATAEDAEWEPVDTGGYKNA